MKRSNPPAAMDKDPHKGYCIPFGECAVQALGEKTGAFKAGHQGHEHERQVDQPQGRRFRPGLGQGVADPAVETTLRLAQGLPNAEQTLEITGSPATPLAALRVYTPPLPGSSSTGRPAMIFLPVTVAEMMLPPSRISLMTTPATCRATTAKST